VGVVSTAKYFAPQMLAVFARAHPGIDMELIIGNREDTIAAFESGRFDVAIMGRPPEGIEVESAVIGNHPQVIIAPPDHPLAKQRSISPREIAKQTILMREVGSGTRLVAEKFLAEHGIKPRIGMEIASNETIKQAVMAGLGIAFISAHTIAAEIGDGRLAILDVAGLPEIRQWFVVRPATKRMMPAASSLRDFLVAEGRRFLPTVKHGRRLGKSPAARGNHPAKKK
jgi:LysR family transcriptional regulator for metE and metH